MFKITRNIIRFILVILLQVLIINKLELSYYLNPIIVTFAILALPLNTPHWFLLSSSFLLGIILDAFLNTPGITSFSLVGIAFFRPFILKLFEPRDNYQTDDEPNVKRLGWSWYFKYAFIFTFGFHLIYFFVLGFSQDNILVILGRTITSTAFSLLLFSLFQFFNLNDGH